MTVLLGASQLSIQQAALWKVALCEADAKAAEKVSLLTVKARRVFACSLALGIIIIPGTWSLGLDKHHDKPDDIQSSWVRGTRIIKKCAFFAPLIPLPFAGEFRGITEPLL